MADSTTIQSGPILYYRGHDAEVLRLAVLVVTDGEPPPPLRLADGTETAAAALHARKRGTLWRYDVAVPLAGETAEYTLADRSWSIRLPTDASLRVAFTACNGNKHGDDREWDTPHRNAMWRSLADEHAARPFHLLLQGGDQLYADDIWNRVPALVEWQRRPLRRQLEDPPPEGLREAAADFYFERYRRLWAQADIAPLLATIPSLMMWDDHDIFDGWGSHPDALQRSPTFQCVWEAAREQFALFQLAASPDALPPGFADRGGSHFGWAFRVGRVGLIAPDLRSQRTRRGVLDEDAREWLFQTLHTMADCERIFLLSTVPLANLNLSALERFVVFLPGQQGYQDDLRDQWQSYVHRAEWRHLVHRLFEFTGASGTPLTVLSGEIHLAAHGHLERRGAGRIDQLISSGIAHHPPPRWLARLYDILARRPRTFGDGITMRMVPLPGHGCRYLASRNWLSLDCRPDGPMAATWYAEGHTPATLWLR